MKSLLIFLSLFSASQTFAQTKTKVDDREEQAKRIQELETKFEELQKRQTDMYRSMLDDSGQVKAFLGRKLSLGGFFEHATTAYTGPDTKPQASAGGNLFGINIAAEFNDQSRFVSQFLTGLSYGVQNTHNDPSVTPSHRQFGTPSIGAIVAQAYSEFEIDPVFKIQVGLGYVPFGHSYQLREPVLFLRRGGPQMITTGGSTTGLAFPLWMGVHFFGSFPVSGSRAGYNLYTFSPFLSPGTIGEGARVWWEPNDSLTVGVSGQAGKQADDDYYSYGADIAYKFRNASGVILEYARNVFWNGSPSPQSYYVEPYYAAPGGKWIFYVAADYIDFPNYKASGAASADPYSKWIYGAGLNWLPLTYTRFRIGLLHHDYTGDTAVKSGQNRDYESLDLSAGIAF
jgi:hypothetical protein